MVVAIGVSAMQTDTLRTGRLLRAVSVFLGVVLLVAGGLKLAGLSDASLGRPGTTWWYAQAGLAAFELGFGVWMLAGLYPRWTRLAALATFLAFFNIALSRALAGEASCGCAGAVKFSPWWAVGFDLAAVLALAMGLPATAMPIGGRWRWAGATAGMVLALGAVQGERILKA
jgi:hypothetical protein